MPLHALTKLKELENKASKSLCLSNNYDYLFLKSKALCKLENYQEAYDCCMKLKKLHPEPNESLNNAILGILAKIEEEHQQNDLTDLSKLAKTMTEKRVRDASVPNVSLLTPIDPNASSPISLLSTQTVKPMVELDTSSLAHLEPIRTTILEPIRLSDTSYAVAREKDPVTTIKELADRGIIHPPCYSEVNNKPFTIKCSLNHGKMPYDAIGEGANRKLAKNNAAKAMIVKLKNAAIIKNC